MIEQKGTGQKLYIWPAPVFLENFTNSRYHDFERSVSILHVSQRSKCGLSVKNHVVGRVNLTSSSKANNKTKKEGEE
jgi:hypothetical protein